MKSSTSNLKSGVGREFECTCKCYDTQKSVFKQKRHSETLKRGYSKWFFKLNIGVFKTVL